MSTSALSRIFVALRALVYSAGFIWLWAWIALQVRAYDARLVLSLPFWTLPLGVLLAVAGAAIALACIATFVAAGRGTPAPFDPPREFVAVGPYRYVRNPMYVGALIVILGSGLALRSLSIVGLAVAFGLLMHLFVILYEEPILLSRFGASYSAYKAAVRRWLPGRPWARR